MLFRSVSKLRATVCGLIEIPISSTISEGKRQLSALATVFRVFNLL